MMPALKTVTPHSTQLLLAGASCKRSVWSLVYASCSSLDSWGRLFFSTNGQDAGQEVVAAAAGLCSPTQPGE